MDFNLSKEQELLRDGLGKFLSTRYDLEKSRAAAKTGPGWQPDIWRGFANELGILGAALPEDVGGIGGGPVEIMVIAEALGHALAVEPYVDTVVVAGGLLHRAGGPVATPLLEKIVEGTAVVALAAAEASSGDHWQEVSTTAERDGDGWTLRGSKIVAMSAPLATHLLVNARTANGTSLFVIDLDGPGPGFEMHAYRTVDDRRAADITFDGLRLPGDALLGEEGQAWPSIATARDEGAAAVCAEAVGCMRKVLADTVEYAKQRQQFGQPDRQLPGTAAPHGGHVHGTRAVRRRRLSRRPQPRRRAGGSRAGGVGGQGDDRARRSLHRPAGGTAARRHGNDGGTRDRPLLQAADRGPVRVRVDGLPRQPVRGADAAVGPLTAETYVSQTKVE